MQTHSRPVKTGCAERTTAADAKPRCPLELCYQAATDMQMTEQMDGNNEEAEAPNQDAKAGQSNLIVDREPQEPMLSPDVHWRCVDKQPLICR